ASFNCLVLALNRIVEMIPFANGLRFLFEGKTLLLWMALSVAYMVVLPFINRSHPYNTVAAAYIPSPVITDDEEKETAHYVTLMVPIHNITFVVALLSLYTILCVYIIRIPRTAKGRNYKMQVQLFIQVFLICSTTAIAAILHVLMMFFTVSRNAVVLANVLWQLSHGLHGIIYLSFNHDIRYEVLKMFRRKKQGCSTRTVPINTWARAKITGPKFWMRKF
uniref:G protein-coupled receptor n=1 Tax=Haemonchus contortus TaxID=6289 RepID=A0A7I5EBW2_HAECO